MGIMRLAAGVYQTFQQQASTTEVTELLKNERIDSTSSSSFYILYYTSTMGAANSITDIVANVNESKADLKIFLDTFADLAKPGKAAGAERAQSWLAVDPNGNGLVSLAEFDGWIQKSLKLDNGEDEGDRIWKLYRPAYIRAFNDAKDTNAEREVKSVGDATTDDYVTKGEFRIACAFLCSYVAMFDCFNMIDGGSEGTTATDDRRMSAEEWATAWPNLQGGYGFAALKKIADESTEDSPETVFAEMDADGKGMVLLIEWCKFLEKGEIAAGGLCGRMLAAGDDD
jgi:hypothetical protein